MVKKAPPRRKPPIIRTPTYSREWREYRDDMTLEQAAALSGMSIGNISAIERGAQGVTDRALYSLAKAYRCDPMDLFRNPLHGEPIWRIWERAKPGDRVKLLEIAKTLVGSDEKR
jgi:transcriptional regulator with XRE-family HTH domain